MDLLDQAVKLEEKYIQNKEYYVNKDSDFKIDNIE